MADVWISTGRRFCEICKVWFGNNKISQDHHERGDKHKAMLAQKIRETMQKSKKKEMADAKMNATLAQMEAAAAASMIAHGEGVVQGPQLPATGIVSKVFDPRQFKDVSSMAREMANRRDSGGLKRKGISGATAPPSEQPSMKLTKEDVVSAYRDLTKPSAAGPALPESLAVAHMPETQTQCAEISWVQAKSEQGTYYWNIFDKSSRWDQPSHFYTTAQYEQKCKEFEESREKNYHGLDEVKAVRQGKKDVEYYIREVIANSGLDSQVQHNRKELNIVDKPEKGRRGEKKRRWERNLEEQQTKEEEPTEIPVEEFSLDMDEIPLPPDEEEDDAPCTDVNNILIPEGGEEVKEEIDEYLEENTESGVDVKQEAGNEYEEEKTTIDEPTSSSAAPYGAWVRIKADEKRDTPYESPLTARFREEEEKEKQDAEAREKAEPKIEFGEKTAATMTKKVKGPIEFKKKSTTRSIRKREE